MLFPMLRIRKVTRLNLPKLTVRMDAGAWHGCDNWLDADGTHRGVFDASFLWLGPFTIRPYIFLAGSGVHLRFLAPTLE